MNVVGKGTGDQSQGEMTSREFPRGVWGDGSCGRVVRLSILATTQRKVNVQETSDGSPECLR